MLFIDNFSILSKISIIFLGKFFFDPNIFILTPFSSIKSVKVLEKFLYWCQQLIAESLGKKGKGFFPVVSNVPKDHHSLLQLYLDGPKDKFFYIFSLEEKSKIRLKGNYIII